MKSRHAAGLPATAIVLAGALVAAVLLAPRPGVSQAGAPGAVPAPAASAPAPASAAPIVEPTVPPPVPLGNAPDLDLVFTAQVAGWIEPCG